MMFKKIIFPFFNKNKHSFLTKKARFRFLMSIYIAALIFIPIRKTFIEYSNINIAVCDIVKKKQSIYLPFFENFYPYIKENFNKNYDKLLEFAQKKMADVNVQNKNFKTRLYNMHVNINYENVITKLNESKEQCEIV